MGGGKIIPVLLLIAVLGVVVRQMFPGMLIPFHGLCFMVMPSLLLGYFLNRQISSKPAKHGQCVMLFLLIVCMAMTFMEAWAWGNYMMSPYMMTFLTSLMIFLLFLQTKYKSCKVAELIARLGKDCSLGVYIIHPIVINLLCKSFGETSWVVQPWNVFVISLLAVYVYNLCKNKILRKKTCFVN